MKTVERMRDSAHVMYHGLYMEEKLLTSTIRIVKPGACHFMSSGKPRKACFIPSAFLMKGFM